MPLTINIVLLVVAFASVVSAARYQTLLYRPNGPLVARPLPYNPRNPPRVMTLPYRPSATPLGFHRVRRAAVGGAATTNLGGGVDVVLKTGEAIGNPIHNVAAGVLASGNSQGGPVTTGGQLEYNLGGHQLSATQLHTPGDRDIFKQNARVNIFDDGVNKFDANVFKSQTNLANGFDFKTTGGSLNWANDMGHNARIGMSQIPDFGRTYEVGGSANLWSSPDKATTLDLYGSATKTFGGPFDGQRNFRGGLSLTSLFG